jgi:hypothetical protein
LEENSPPSLTYDPLDCRVPLASLGVLAMTAHRHRNRQLTLEAPLGFFCSTFSGAAAAA